MTSAAIVVVGTHHDQLTETRQKEIVRNWTKSICTMYPEEAGYPRLACMHAMCSTDRAQVDRLKADLYKFATALRYSIPHNQRSIFLKDARFIGRQVCIVTFVHTVF